MTIAAAALATDLPAAVDDILQRLRAAGAQASLTEQDLTPPGFLLQLPTVRFRFGKLCHDADWRLWAVAGSTGREQALPVLSALIDTAAAALGYRFTSATPVDLQSLSGALLPAFELTWSAKL